jgi:Na+/H+ antiporter NhaD/arsenite permease-like protein
VKQHALTIGAGIIAVALLVSGRVTIAAAQRATDLDLLLVLFALLVSVELLRVAGFLDLAVAKTITRFRTTRGFAMALIAFSGVLASLVTNDVTLFVVIPFTVVASRFSDFDVEDAVILEIIATNLIGCLTPLGNPQNLFVFHRSGWPAAHFIAVMAPFVGWSIAGLLAALFILGSSRAMTAAALELPLLDRTMAVAGGVTFALVLLEIARVTSAWPAAIAALLSAMFLLKKRALRIDYSIVPLFLFAFIIIEGMRSVHVRGAETHLYATSIALSQFISNVPATILLSPFVDGRWRELLYGVNAGGCGTIIASLANLLGWRIYVRESGKNIFGRLTAINFVFLSWIALGGWVLL